MIMAAKRRSGKRPDRRCFAGLCARKAQGWPLQGAGLCPLRGQGGRSFSLGRVVFSCTYADVVGCSFPLAGKNQRATGGSQSEPAPWLPPAPRRLVWARNLRLRKANSFLAGAAWNGLRCHACCLLAAGRHRWAALVGRGVVGLSGDGYCVWTDRSDKVRFSATVHGRRSMSSLRRPPQEVAASLN